MGVKFAGKWSPALLVNRDWFREEPPTKSLENDWDTPRGRFQITKSDTAGEFPPGRQTGIL